MNENMNIRLEAQNAYRKFIKSSRKFLDFSKKKKLKSFTEIQKEENAYNSIYLGIKEIPIKKIIGSVEKFEDFDENFVPRNSIIKQRWINLYVAYVNGELVPTVKLYKIKDDYYVYDGNHRVSVANYLNFSTIEAEVEEFLPTIDHKDEVIYRENMIFEKETGLENILLTEPNKYKYLKEEIDNYILLNYKNIEKIDELPEIEYKKLVKEWYNNIFLPIINLLKENNILENFENKNINDIFSYFLEHKYYLSKNYEKNMGYCYSIINFINLIKTKGKRDIFNIFEIIDEKNWEKLDKIDKVIFNKKIDNNERKKVIKILENRVYKLPNKYLNEFYKLKKDKFFEYIKEYLQIKSKLLCKKLRIDEFIILEYIIEIFIPILDKIIDYKNENLEVNIKYEKLQSEYFYLLKLEKNLLEEGKEIKYEDILPFNWNDFGENIIKNKLLEDKKNEFLNNLKNKNKFLEIIKKYGKIEKYETYILLFKWLDIIGENELLEKLNTLLNKLNDKDIVVYKTNKILKLKNKKENIGIIDFFLKNKNI